MPTTTIEHPLRLEPVAGPHTPPIEIPARSTATIGRSLQCDHTLSNEAVSRRHATLIQRAGHWLISDLGSRHGTNLNGQPVPIDQPALMSDDDLVGIGPYAFRVNLGGRRRHMATTFEDRSAGQTRIERVGDFERGRLAQHRLDLLVQCASTIHGAADEQALADAVLESLLAGSGFHHAVLLRPRPGSAAEVEVIGHQHRSGAEMQEVKFSRSLIDEASQGEMVRLVGQADLPRSVSIAELGISEALCAPIMLGASVAAYLYLDARGQAAPIESDAAGFCQAVARMCGLALANLKRQELERRQQTLEAEMTAAREAQQMIVPADEGTVGPIRYSVQSRPGFFVAGDLFDVIELNERQTAVCIGDVTGEGVAAGVIMAAAQSHLHGSLQRDDDPAAAVKTVNDYLARRSAENRFVSLWVGVFDADRGTVRFVDAGHGHWFIRPNGAVPSQPEFDGGIPIGVQEGYPYETEELPIGPGDRFILYSDGLVEQQSPDGPMFGKERVAEVVGKSTTSHDDVRLLLSGLEAFAGGTSFHDDTTIASIEVV